MRFNPDSFNPRTSCEVRLYNSVIVSFAETVSIHAPRVRCDFGPDAQTFGNDRFNPRTSCEVRRNVYLIF